MHVFVLIDKSVLICYVTLSILIWDIWSNHHKKSSVWEGEPTNHKGTNRLPTSQPLWSIVYCSGSLEPEYSCHDRDWIMELPMEADILTFTGILTPEDASVASCFPLWYHDQPKLVPSPQYTSITLRYTIGDGNFQLVPGRHFSNPENTNVPWRLPNVYPESYDWGLPDHRLVDWPHGLTSLDRPPGLTEGHRSWAASSNK